MNGKSISATIAAGILWSVVQIAHADTINTTLCVRQLDKTMSDGATVRFWGFTDNCGGGMASSRGMRGAGMGGGGMGGGQVPGPAIEVGVYPAGVSTTDTLNLTLDMMMAPQEEAPYDGHTIHLHGADVPTAEDGVPETGASVNGDTYTWTPTRDMAGSYPYHCHVHTVKHLEMGMYGAFIARPKNAAGQWLNQLTQDAATAFDYVQNYMLSTVDPAYHTAVGDSKVFADYNPRYFLIQGNEGVSRSSPAVSLQAAVNKKVALRLIGMHSVNATFQIRDAAGETKPFTIYVEDGRALATPETVTSVEISPGQREDIIFTTPSTSGAWYPQVTYKHLRDGTPYATAYGRVSF